MPDRLGIGIIGLRMGYSHFVSVRDNPRARLAGVCDLDQETVDRVAADFEVSVASTDYEDVLASDEVDVVSICTPDHFHAEYTIKALEAGKHVLVEKPMARDVAECEDMIAKVRETGKSLMVGQVCRFYPFFEQIKGMVEDGVLGEVFHIDSTYIHNMEGTGGVGNWRCDPAIRHPFVGGGCHPIDLVRHICGDVVEVHAYGNHYNIPERQTEDHINANLKFASGAVGRVMVSVGCTRPYAIRCHVWGTKGTVEGDNVEDTAQFTLRSFSDWKQKMIAIPTHKGAKPVAGELDHFITCVLEGRRPLIDEVEGARTVATCRAAVESMASGEPVKVKNEF